MPDSKTTHGFQVLGVKRFVRIKRHWVVVDDTNSSLRCTIYYLLDKKIVEFVLVIRLLTTSTTSISGGVWR